MKVYAFEKLDVYQKARKFRKGIWDLTRTLPQNEIYGLRGQLKRAVSSITANLAEGSGKSTNTDKAHYTNIAYCSGLEIVDHLNGALDCEYITGEIHKAKREELDEIIAML